MIAPAVESTCVIVAAYTNVNSTRIKIEWSEWDEQHGRDLVAVIWGQSLLLTFSRGLANALCFLCQK